MCIRDRDGLSLVAVVMAAPTKENRTADATALLNYGFAHFTAYMPAADTAHSLELGMIRCVADIREQVRRDTGLSLTDAQIENMLAGQPCTVSDTVRDIVNKQGRKYTEDVYKRQIPTFSVPHFLCILWWLSKLLCGMFAKQYRLYYNRHDILKRKGV